MRTLLVSLILLCLLGAPALAGGDSPVFGLMSPDGCTVAVLGPERSHSVDLYDRATGQKLASVQPPGSDFSDMAFSPDSRRLAVASYDERIDVFDSRTGEPVARLASGRKADGASLGGYLVSFVSPDEISSVGWTNGKASMDPEARVWSISEGKPVWSTVGVIDPSGQWAAEELVTEPRTRILPRRGASFMMAGEFSGFLSEGVILKREDEQMVLAPLPQGPVRVLGPEARVVAGPGGRLAFLSEHEVRLGGTTLRPAPDDQRGGVVSRAVFSPSGDEVLLITARGEAFLYRLRDSQPAWRIVVGDAGMMDSYGAQFTPDGKHLLVSSLWSVRLVRAEDGSDVRAFR